MPCRKLLILMSHVGKSFAKYVNKTGAKVLVELQSCRQKLQMMWLSTDENHSKGKRLVREHESFSRIQVVLCAVI